jgi:predicted kinase
MIHGDRYNGLTITIGCPGAGKSTWADANLAASTLRLERDRFRECLFGSRKAYHASEFDRAECSAVVTQAMLNALFYWPEPSWAVTDTGIDQPAVAPFISYAERLNLPVRLVVFDRPLPLLAERNRTRPEDHRIPEDILFERYNAFKSPLAWWRSSEYATEYAA